MSGGRSFFPGRPRHLISFSSAGFVRNLVLPKATSADVVLCPKEVDRAVDAVVSPQNFIIPEGIAFNRDLKENLFACLVSVETKVAHLSAHVQTSLIF